ncbi:MAG: stage V sporulation protein AC [Pelotomaculaceae bacterium]|jgi:stage V sporulation protein AC|uniref:Mechanosensitive channel stage V sporulation protein AC n=1 Tax=anaerobic digester metagenome TaxID=1263854 RepID=A0A485LVL4_9ZZZZ|nr:stage V sporulation protein AC [Bacillota bacterium]HHU86263.1 stage V sporulation protein AC [Peptococcaceae bacterium]
MSDKKMKKLTPVQQEYQTFAKAREPRRPVLFNCLKAFLVGGGICLLGQGVQDFFIWNFDFTEKTAGDPTVAVMVMLSVILTVAGVYDHIAQWAGAGTAVPVTGFANSVAASAMEHRTEGFVLGVGGQMFKLAGSVIVYGVFAAFIIGLIKTGIAMLGGS